MKLRHAIVFSILVVISTYKPAFCIEKLNAFVSIVPQKYFVQQIGKELVDVSVMVQPGASPATYEPKPRQMAALSKAKLYFAIDVPFEKAWLDKIAAANPDMDIIRTDEKIHKIPMDKEHTHDNDHENHDHHHVDSDESLDPHIWLSPNLVKQQAKAILNALKKKAPGFAKEFEANFSVFEKQINRLDDDLRLLFHDSTEKQFMVFHPSWGYFAKDYGLVQIPIEIQGKNPKPAQLGELIRHARQRDIRVVFVQPQFSTKSAQLIAREIGGKVIFAGPLAPDWLANLKLVGQQFKEALK